MNDTQTWTTIGGLFTVLSAFLGVVVGSVERSIKSLETSMRFGFDTMNARFDRLGARVDGLDRNVTTVMRRHFGS